MKKPGMRIFSKNVARARSARSGGKAAIVSVAAARACGKLIRAGGMPAAFTAMPTIRQMAWQTANSAHIWAAFRGGSDAGGADDAVGVDGGAARAA